MLHRAVRNCVLTALCLAVAGCANDSNLVRDVARASGVTGGEPRAAPDFVSRGRAAEPGYLPIAPTSRPRVRPKNADDVADVEAEMNAISSRNAARAAVARREGQGPAPKAVPRPADL